MLFHEVISQDFSPCTTELLFITNEITYKLTDRVSCTDQKYEQVCSYCLYASMIAYHKSVHRGIKMYGILNISF